MLDYGAPGRYLQGRESTPMAVTSTAVAGFVGIAERGPIDIPQAIHGWGEYLEVFGGFVPYGYLADSVFAFYMNGGVKCYVVRAAGATGDPGGENQPGQCPGLDPLSAAAAVQTVVDRNGDETLRVSAIDEGSWGNQVRFSIVRNPLRVMELTRLRAPLAPTETAVAVEDVTDIEPGSVVQITAADAPWLKTRYLVAGVRPQDREIDLQSGAGANYPIGSSLEGAGFRLEVRFGDMEEVFDNLSMSPEHPRHFLRIINGDGGQAEYLERRRQGHSILIRIEQVLDGSSGAVRFQPQATPGIDAPDAFRLQGGGDGRRHARATFADVSGNDSIRLFARRAGTTGLPLRIEIEPFATTTALPLTLESGSDRRRVVVESAAGFETGDALTLSTTDEAESPVAETRELVSIDTQNGLSVQSDFLETFPLGSTASVQGRFNLLVFEQGRTEPVETHRNLSTDPADTIRFFHTVINADSGLLCADAPTDPIAPPVGQRLLGEATDPGQIDHRYYSGYESDGSYFVPPGADPDRIRGTAALEEVTEVSLVALPDLCRVSDDGGYLQGQKALLSHCSKLGDRFALLDPPVAMPAGEVRHWPGNFAEGTLTRNGALYFPWLLGLFEKDLRSIPPCGFIAGAIAQSDRLFGVNKAPANMALKGVAAPVEIVDQVLQVSLNPAGVNCIRKFEDGQIRLFGARTLSRDSRFLYVNKRRVLLSVVKALSRNLRWAVFEPNDQFLWKRIETAVAGYLSGIVTKGMAAGAGPEESFYVRCNAETNSLSAGEEGLVVAEIGLALSAPAEFIVLTARKSPESLSIVEEET